MPTQVLAEKKVPMGSGGTPHYYLPTQVLVASYALASEVSKIDLIKFVKGFKFNKLKNVKSYRFLSY